MESNKNALYAFKSTGHTPVLVSPSTSKPDELSLFTDNIFQPDIQCLETLLEQRCPETAWFCSPYTIAPGSVSVPNYLME